MKNTLWNKLNNRNQKRKSNYEISKKTNIPEEKVKEIMNGEREVPTERVDDFVNAISENNKVEREISVATAKKWINETDLKALRLSFNYATQGELAEELGVHSSVICRLENKILNHVSDGLLIKYYDFLHNDLNKRVKRKKKAPTKKVKVVELDLDNISDDVVNKWYEEFDFKSYLTNEKLNNIQFATILGYSKHSSSLVSALCNHTLNIERTGTLIVKKAYAYINGLIKPQETTLETQTTENDIVIKEDENTLQGLSADVQESKNEDITNPVENYFKVMDDPYEYDFPTNNVTSTATYNTVDGSYHINTDIVEPEKITIYQYIWDNLNKNLEEKESKIKELETQVSRYEKLIDMIK